MANPGRMIEAAIEKAKKEDPVLVGELTLFLAKPSLLVLSTFLIDIGHADWLWQLEQGSAGNITTVKEITGNEAIVCVYNANGKSFTLADATQKYGLGLVKIKLINATTQKLWPEIKSGLIPIAHITGDEVNIAKLIAEATKKDVGFGVKQGKDFAAAYTEFEQWA